MFEVNMYVESSTRNIKRIKRRYGIVLEYELKNGIQTREFFGEEIATYNQIVLKAIIEGLNHLKDGCKVMVYQNNGFVTSMANQNMVTWESNGFRTKKGERIKNQKEWSELAEKMKQHHVTIETVGSHQYSNWLMTEMDKYDDKPKGRS